MSNDVFIGIDPSALDDVERVKRKLSKLITPQTLGRAVDKVSDYLLNIFKTYPAYKKVTRREAYGRTFFTAKQRRYFFWALNRGVIRVPYRRTQGYRRAWKKVGEGVNTILVNESPYAIYLQDDERQSRMAQRIGWRTLSQMIAGRSKRIGEITAGEIRREARRLGLIR